jgi:hypothetical protein
MDATDSGLRRRHIAPRYGFAGRDYRDRAGDQFMAASALPAVAAPDDP